MTRTLWQVEIFLMPISLIKKKKKHIPETRRKNFHAPFILYFLFWQILKENGSVRIVLVQFNQAAITRSHWVAYKQQKSFTVLQARSSDQVPVLLGSGENLRVADANFTLCLHRAGRAGSPVGRLETRAPIPFLRAPPSWPCHPTKVQLLVPPYQRWGFKHVSWGAGGKLGDINIQTIVGIYEIQGY